MELAFLKLWNYGREYCAVEHRTDSNAASAIFCVRAIRKKGEFELEETLEENSVAQLASRLKKKQHCFLIINGKQVLMGSTTTTGNDHKILAAAFPNIDFNEFYYEILQTSGVNLVALCRKEHAHKILASYKKENINVVGFSLSFFRVQHLIGLMDGEKVTVSNYTLSKSSGNIISYKKDSIPKEETYQIGDTAISSKFLLGMAGLFGYEMRIQNSSSNVENKNSSLRKEHEQQVLFKKGLFTGVSVLLLSLLLNFLFFTSYHSSLQSLSGQHQLELAQKKLMDERISLIEDKEKTVKNIRRNSNSRSSFYINRIISNKPNSILFNEFTYQPLEKQVKESEPIELKKNLILIKGEIKDERLFSEWIKDLEETPWISRVQVSDFSFKSSKTSDFTISINLKDETVE